MLGLGSVAKKVFGTVNDRKIKSVKPLVAKINALEPDMEALDDTALRALTESYRTRLAEGETVDDLLPEAFATVREAAKRALGMRHFDVQLMGGIFLHQGNIAEMKTGEGKTLVATLPVYLNALPAKGVHVVTVNDYLARRDAEWMAAIYEFLGMSVGIIAPGMEGEERKAAYACDITYATNNELGFDYLRDNMKSRIDQMAQRGHHFAIVDEVDSILIDEARTPLIISGPTEDRSALYVALDGLIPSLTEEHFELEEKDRRATLTDEGNDFVESLLLENGMLAEGASLYDPESATLVHHVNQALRAHKLFKKDEHYIVRRNEIVLIDEFTGRMMDGRRLGDGLHQAIEAKEGVEIKPENVTLASVTYQNYFRLYSKLSGMTGTAMTEADEFLNIYGLDVIEIPTNLPIARIDNDDQVYRTTKEKFEAVVRAIRIAVEKGQPTLVGTTSIEKSELLSALLKKEGIAHKVLNARFHEQEASIIAQAGRPGAVTIATNMAGRGTDIKLGGNVEMRISEEIEKRGSMDEAAIAALTQEIEAEIEADKQKVLDAGGLFVLATERHESRRIDNQLRGRSGRQGDPGRTNFFLSLEDDLMRIFGSDRLDKMLKSLGMEEGEAIIHPWVNKALERAQGKVEGRNFEFRKQVLKYDDVMNDQRKEIFNERLEIMQAEDVSDIITDMRHEAIDDLVDQHIPRRAYAEQWNTADLQASLTDLLGVELPVVEWAEEDGIDEDALRERLYRQADENAAKKVAQYTAPVMREVEKELLLHAIDSHWREHLLKLEHLRSVIGFRGYAQRDPLNEYKSEAFQLFDGLLNGLRAEVTKAISHVIVRTPDEQQAILAQMQAMAEAQAQAQANAEQASADAAPDAPQNPEKISRNAPCPCGSGKKYKHCHGSA